MRLLHCIASLDPAHGGPVDGVHRLTEAWRGAGHRVAIATLDPPDAPFLPADPEVHALGDRRAPARDPFHRLLDHYRWSPRAVPWLRAQAPGHDAVIVHGLWNYMTMAARRTLVGGPAAYLVFPHGSLDPWFRRTYPAKHAAKALLWRVNEGPLMNGARAALFTTQEEARLAERAFAPWRVTPAVTGFGCAEPPDDAAGQRAAFLAQVPALAGRRFLLFLGRIHPKKGCDLLVEAFAPQAAADPALDLVIAGPDRTGWRPALEARAAALGIAHRIHWTGMVGGAAKWGAYRAAEAFVLPSHSENFGVVVAEALACGCPALITDKVNLWREVEAAGAGLVAPDTPEGIAALLDRWRGMDATARGAMAAAARRCFEAHFRFDVAARRILDLCSGAAA